MNKRIFPKLICLIAVVITHVMSCGISLALQEGSEPIDSLDRAKLIRRVKLASAVAFSGKGHFCGAFYIGHGQFVSTRRALSGVDPGQPINLIIGSGTESAIRLTGVLEATDPDCGLALISADQLPDGFDDRFTPLKLGDANKIADSSEVIVTAYPEPTKMRTGPDPTDPLGLTFFVKTAKFTNTEKDGLQIKIERLDTNKLMDGGAVLTSNGEVIGVVFRDFGNKNQIVPINRFFDRLWKLPRIVLEAPGFVHAVDLTKKITINVEVQPRFPDDEREFSIQGSIYGRRSRSSQEINFEKISRNKFSSTLSLVVESDVREIAFQADYGDKRIAGSLPLQQIKLGDHSVDLVDIEKIWRSSKTQDEFRVELRSGKIVSTSLDAEFWREVPVQIDDEDTMIDLQHAQAIRFPRRRTDEKYTLYLTAYDDNESLIQVKREIDVILRPRFDVSVNSVNSDAADAPIRANLLFSHEQIRVPSRIFDTCFGGGGKYMFVARENSRQITVIDLDKRAQIGTIDAGGEKFLFAAGNSRLFVYQQNSRQIKTIELADFEKQTLMKFEAFKKITTMAMGHSSDSPLVITGTDKDQSIYLAFLDPGSLEVNNRPIELVDAVTDPRTRRKGRLRVSAGGQVAAYTDRQNMYLVDHHKYESGELVEIKTLGTDVIPSNDGNWILTRNNSLWFPGLSSGYDFAGRMRPDSVPGLNGDLLLSWREVPNRREGYAPRQLSMRLWQLKREKGLASLTRLIDAPQLNNLYGSRWNYTPEKQFVFDPTRNLLGILGDYQIQFFTIDVDRIIGQVYITVLSIPPTEAAVGDELVYPIKVKSNASKVIYSFHEKPDGMTISDRGIVRWRPNADQNYNHDVMVILSDGNGVETQHEFTIRVRKN